MNRYGIAELSAWVDMPLPDSKVCLELSERKIISDEVVRRLTLGKGGAINHGDRLLIPLTINDIAIAFLV